MTSCTNTSERPFRELAYRESDGIEVSLLWNAADNALSLFVSDERTGDAFELAVGTENPLEVFNHPYAYAAFRGIQFLTPRSEPAWA